MQRTMAVAYHLVKLRIQWHLAFRVDAAMDTLSGIVRLASGLLLFEVTLGYLPDLGGWERPALYALAGTWTLLMELEAGLFRGLQHLPRLVRGGTLEQYLLRPAPTPLFLALRRMNPAALWRLPLGLAAVLYAGALAPPPWWRAAVYGISLILSLALYELVLFCLLCSSFWFVQMNNLFHTVYDLMEFARYPASVYRGATRVLLSTALPLLILANFPVMLLARGAGPGLLLQQLAVTSAFAALATWLWRRGLRTYQGAGG